MNDDDDPVALYLQGDHDGAAYLVALSQKDGSTAWKIDRENKTRSYSHFIYLFSH